jgi:PIN domain nuclease of toxin-antitoxin system
MIVLDTHAWFWVASEPQRVSPAATAAIREARQHGGIAVSSISLWELALSITRGRVDVRGRVEPALAELVEATAVTVKDITPAIAALAAQLPADFPGDPADRIIAATALVEGVGLVTRDTRIRSSSVVRTVW